MKNIFLITSLIWALCAQGCQWLVRMDETRRFNAAIIDDRECRRSGYNWPSDAYLDCRRFRYDARQRELWQELQMARQQQQPEVGIRAESPVEPYRPVRAENFRCDEAAAENGETWINCNEQ